MAVDREKHSKKREPGSRSRRWWIFATELITGVALASGAFVLLVMGLHHVFPDSTDLGQLVRGPRTTYRDGVLLHLDTDAEPAVVATLSSVHNDVREKPATSITAFVGAAPSLLATTTSSKRSGSGRFQTSRAV